MKLIKILIVGYIIEAFSTGAIFKNLICTRNTSRCFLGALNGSPGDILPQLRQEQHDDPGSSRKDGERK